MESENKTHRIWQATQIFYLKPTEAGRKLLRVVDMRPPYDGAKDYFYIADVDDRNYLSELVRETCQELSMPKPKKKK